MTLQKKIKSFIICAGIIGLGALAVKKAMTEYNSKAIDHASYTERTNETLENRIKTAATRSQLLPQEYTELIARAEKAYYRKDFKEAMEACNQALLYNKGYLAFNLKGMVYVARGKPVLAEQEFNKAIKLNALDAAVFHNRARAKYQQKRIPEAKKDLLHSLELDPELETSCLDLGAIYLSEKNFKDAKKYYSKTLKVNPNNTRALLHRGFIYIKEKKYDLSIQDNTKLIKLAPDNDIAYNNRGCAYHDSGQTEKAIKDFKKAIEINSSAWKPYRRLGIILKDIKYLNKAMENAKTEKHKKLIQQSIDQINSLPHD